jgi:hypothetical protein
VVYRFGDLTSSWLTHAALSFGIAGAALLGVVISAAWFPIAWALGRRYESRRGDVSAARAE